MSRNLSREGYKVEKGIFTRAVACRLPFHVNALQNLAIFRHICRESWFYRKYTLSEGTICISERTSPNSNKGILAHCLRLFNSFSPDVKESGIRNPESSKCEALESGIQTVESGIHCMESRIYGFRWNAGV